MNLFASASVNSPSATAAYSIAFLTATGILFEDLHWKIRLTLPLIAVDKQPHTQRYTPTLADGLKCPILTGHLPRLDAEHRFWLCRPFHPESTTADIGESPRELGSPTRQRSVGLYEQSDNRSTSYFLDVY